MFIKIVIGEAGEDIRQSSEIIVNPNCPIRVIYDYIQQSFNIDCDLEFDLCDENGNLVFMYEKEPWTYGTEYLVPRTTYFVVLFERDYDNRVTNPMLYIPELFRKPGTQMNELVMKIKKQINPVQTSKASRTVKTRSSASTMLKQ